MSCSSRATLEALEFPALLAVLAGFAGSDVGRREILALTPQTDVGEIERRRALYREVEGELAAAGALVPHIEQPLLVLREQLESGGDRLTGADLLELATVIETSEEVVSRLADDEATPLAAVEVERLRVLELDAGCEGAARFDGCAALAARLRRALDRRGVVREDASPRLRELVRTGRRAQAALESTLRTWVRAHADDLADDSTPMRGGRLSVLLPSGSRGRLPGLARGRSASGRSFYFEPAEVVQGNDELERIDADREAERARILAELVRNVRQLAPALTARVEFLGAVDALQATVRFATAVEACLPAIAPTCRGDEGSAVLNLCSARHPLLDPRLAERRREILGAAGNRGDIVPLDLCLDDRRTLVLTGPNAGGKTIALKTVGLLCLMSQAGLPVPARPDSRLPLFEHLVAVVGDDQSVLDEQSTFSSRLLRLQEVWNRASARSLVLLDEVGAGTNPEEGAALGIALLEGLLERRSFGVLTTHLTQLAAAALESPVAFCAAMGFDPQNGLPTYRLNVGPPGGSQALALARRLGLPGTWLERAEDCLGSEHQQLRRMLARNEQLRERLLEREADLARRIADAEEERGRLETERQALRAVRKRLGQAVTREVDSLRRANRRRLDDALRQFRSRTDRPGKRALARVGATLHAELDRDAASAVDGAAANVESETAAPTAGLRPPGGDLPIGPGSPVRHRSLGWTGELRETRGARATVLVRGKRVQTALDELEPVAAARASEPGRVRVETAPSPPIEDELLLIGQLVEPALDALDGYLDRALAAGREQVRVVHGHGTGRLRRAVRERLRGHPAVTGFEAAPPSAGGDGATVVCLR